MTTPRPRSRRTGRLAAAAIAALSISLAGLSTAEATNPATKPDTRSATKPDTRSAPAPRAAPAATHQVTLITGDRVTVTGDDQVSIEPGPGRARMPSARTGSEAV